MACESIASTMNMKRYLGPVVILLILGFVLGTSCGPGLQTFNNHGISFKVSKELKLEEYTVNFEKQTFRRGTASYEQGAVLSTEKNFMFLWLTTVPQFSPAEVRSSILSTPNSFESVSGTFRTKIAGDLVKQQVAGFEMTSARMQFTMPSWEASGITAVWYCADNQRTMQVVLIHKQPETELKRFIGSFSESAPKTQPSPRIASPNPTSTPTTMSELKTYIDNALPIMKRHVETTEAGNKANRAFLSVAGSGNQAEVIKALRNLVDTLKWALDRTDSVLLDFKKLIPPSEARTLHSLMIESLVKEQAGLGDMLSYYSAVLSYGFGDDKTLDRGNKQFLEAQKLTLQAQYEFQDLLNKVKK